MAPKNSGTKQAEDFIKNTFDSFSQNVDAFNSFTKQSVDAFVKSSGQASKSAEKIASEVANYTKSNFENCVESAKELGTARSVEQFITIQTEQSKKNFENYVSQMTKLSELYMNLSKEVTTPVAEQAASFTEKFTKKAA